MAKKISFKPDAVVVIVLLVSTLLIILDMGNNKNTTQPTLASGVSITK